MRLAWILIACSAFPTATLRADDAPRVPVILDTDLGSAVDDAFALSVLVASGRFELLGVTTCTSEARERAWMTCRFLSSLGLQDVPVAWGRDPQPESEIGGQIQYRRHPSVVWGRTSKPVDTPAEDFLYSLLERHADRKVTLLAIGPLTNVARLLEKYPEAARSIGRLVVMGGSIAMSYDGRATAEPEWNVRADVEAARKVLASGAALTVVPLDATVPLKLDPRRVEAIFSTHSPLTHELQALYQLSAASEVTLFDPAAVRIALDEEAFGMEMARLSVGDDAITRVVPGEPRARVAMRAERERLVSWLVETLSSSGEAALPSSLRNFTEPVERGGLPAVVHAFEDYESDIEARWWLAGKLQTGDPPPGSRRFCRGVITQDFDGKMGDLKTRYTAVVFNPVPGPPMGKRPRLSFRYKLKGTDSLRVQLFSLTRGYHRYLALRGLPQNRWAEATVDMTRMRRPDGSGGPLSEDERIDDIQFYTDPRAELWIDRMILHDAAAEGERRPFPSRILFTGWFDTGKRGKEWPGDFEIVPHEPPRSWKAARSVVNAATGRPWIRLGLRGERRLAATTRLRFDYHLRAAKPMDITVELRNTRTGRKLSRELKGLESSTWAEASLDFVAAAPAGEDAFADEIRFLLPPGAELLIDDLLLYEAAAAPTARADLRTLDSRCLPESEREEAARMLDRWLDGLFVEAARRENASWKQVSSREDWERFRDRRIEALRRSLGSPLERRDRPRVHVTRRLEGDGYRIENLVFESRPRLAVAANLYLPHDESRRDMPAILIVHSHHRPKTQAELQDMGMTWARAGCAVLVPELIGHGERRDHPFASAGDWPESFRLGRQDYYFRQDLGVQLHLVGESLMGWMVQDLVRSIDVLVAREDVDPRRVIVIGAVAGGGDPAGVTAALDSRIAAAVPFNFGGTQPDYAIPENPDDRFYWFGVPYWESTRALRLGARDGFAHWVIVASLAPRRLVYAHEFAWDRDRDPAWPRIERVFSLHGRGEHLGWATGRGELRGRPPESSHCTNVGRFHREGIHPWLERWFGIRAREFSDPRAKEDLACLTPQIERELGAARVHTLAHEKGEEAIAKLRAELAPLAAAQRIELLRARWKAILGEADAVVEPEVVASSREHADGLRVERVTLRTEPGILVPLLLLSRERDEGASAPVVLVLSRQGKKRVLEERDEGIRELLAAGATVCLADLRGTGETDPGGSGSSLSCRALVAGRTLLGARLRDARAILRWLRGREGAGDSPIAVWGLSLAATNDRDRDLRSPRRIDRSPREGDPLPALLALLAALFDDAVAAVCFEGSIASWLSALESPFVHLVHDSIVPGALSAGDLGDLLGSLAPRPLRGRAFIDALDRPLTETELRRSLETIVTGALDADGRDLSAEAPQDRGESAALWLSESLRVRTRQ